MPDVFYRIYHRSEKNACLDLNGLCPRPSIYTLLKVVSYYDLRVLSMSVRGFQKNLLDGWGDLYPVLFLIFGI